MRKAALRTWAIAATALAVPSAPASAYEDFESTVNGWDVSRAGIYCTLKQTYEGSGQTTLRMSGSALHEKPVFVVMNQKWSAKADEKYNLHVEFDEVAYTLTALGVVDPTEAGFIFQSDADLEALLGKAETLRFYLGGTPIARLDLAGSAAAVAAFRRCLNVMHTERAEWLRNYRAQEAEDNATLPGVPVDPFAQTPAESANPPSPQG